MQNWVEIKFNSTVEMLVPISRGKKERKIFI